MTQFALPPDPAERKHKLAQQKAERKDKAPTPPERDSVHKMVFGIVLYLCLAALVLVLVPAIGGVFVTGRAIPSPQDSDGLVRPVWELLDEFVVVRRAPGGETLFNAFRIETMGPLWALLLVPPALFVAMQLLIGDKAAACRWHGRVAVVIAVALMVVLATTIVDRLFVYASSEGDALIDGG